MQLSLETSQQLRMRRCIHAFLTQVTMPGDLLRIVERMTVDEPEASSIA